MPGRRHLLHPSVGRTVPIIVVLIGICASLSGWWVLVRHQLGAVRDVTAADAAYVEGVIRSELQSRILPLRRMARRWQDNGGTAREPWLADATNHYHDLPGFQAIEWIDTTYHVRRIYPLAGNEQAQDLDLGAEERRRAALERARDSRDISITSTVDLVQGGKGFLVYAPIFIGERFEGFILGVFRVEQFLDTILDGGANATAFALFEAGTRIYGRADETVDARVLELGVEREIELLGLRWTLAAWPTGERYSAIRTFLPEIQGTAGLILFGLVAAAVFLVQTARRRADVIELLRETASAANDSASVEDHFRRCLEAVCQYTGWPVGHVYELDRTAGVLVPTRIWHLESESRFSVFRDVTQKTSFARNIGLPGRVLSTGAPAWIKDVTRDANFPRAKRADNIGVRGAFAFPVSLEDEVVAVFEFFAPRPARPDDSLLDLMQRVSQTSGRALERQHAAAENERLKLEKELILNSAGEGVYGVDQQGDITFANPAATRMLRYTLDELLGHAQHALIQHSYADGSSYPLERSSIRAACKDGAVHTEADEVFWRRDGTSFQVEYTSTPIRSNGTISGAVVVFRDITERKELESRLLELSRVDPLTGLANRRTFDEMLDREWRYGRRHERPLSLVLMDIDYFKNYNDAHGHPTGDLCLKLVSDALAQSARRPRDLVARFGGEEFVAVLPETDATGALAVAEKMLGCVEGLAIDHGRSPVAEHVTISLGVASLIPHADAMASELVARADAALYEAKQAGRNQVATRTGS